MKRGVSVIEPAVHRPEAVHESLGRGAIIRLPVAELIVVQARQKALFVNPLFRQAAQSSLYNGEKFFLLFPLRIFGDHGKIGLKNAIFIPAQNILADMGIDQSLL